MMELLYTINRKPATKTTLNQESLLYDGKTLCTLSSRNVAAFTTTTELDDSAGKTWGSHVYICDINAPWHTHKVLTNKFTVTALEWDLPGDKLVIADSTGNIQLWMFKDHLLNDWQLIGQTTLVGEHILAAAWFHNGKKINLVTEKKDSVHYSEKFNHLSFAPSVRQFGGRAAEGVLVVSTTGMVGAVMLTKDIQNPISFATESLGSTRNRITAVDLCYGKNGQFLVATSNGNMMSPIRCYRVLVRKNDEKCSITSQAWPGFFLQGGGAKDKTATITHLKFVVREAADSVVVAANTETEGFVEIWEVREKPQPIHKLFQAKLLEPYKTVVWHHQNQYRFHSPITAVTTTKISMVTSLPPSTYLLVALTDASIHCLNDCLKEISYSSLNTHWRHDEPSAKYSRQSVTISYMDMSWLGCAFLGCDSRGSLHLYKFTPEGPMGSGPISLNHACTLLEYCLVTGLDWLDLLFCLRASMIETLCERLDASFNRQTPAVQQYHYVQFLCIKTSLYRMLLAGQNKAADLSSLLMVHCVSTAFKSLLRPSDLISHDKGPAESLSAVLSEPITEVDKVLLNLDPKEFTIEPSTLQSLQQLIQWVADLALNLLARLPEQRMQMKSSGYELLKDHKALNTIRELLVIIRIWGLLRPACLPVFLRSADNLDVLALLFRLLSKLVQPSGEAQQSDDGLIDDCCLLPNQIMIPQLHQANSITAIASPTIFYMNLPVPLEYGTEPEFLYFVPELNQIEGCMHSGQVVDTIRHLYLGKQPQVVKQCTRCGGKAQIQNMSRTVAIRAWDQRWSKACRCGGIWRMHKVSGN